MARAQTWLIGGIARALGGLALCALLAACLPEGGARQADQKPSQVSAMPSQPALPALQSVAYRGPAPGGARVTEIKVLKGARKMYLLHHGKLVQSYDIALGRNPAGHKRFEGDGKTPEGRYYINRRNARSNYHLSLGISYPNAQDRALARGSGRDPGGDIFIHGGPNAPIARADWTEGCIAVSDREIEAIYAAVPNGTPVHILP